MLADALGQSLGNHCQQFAGNGVGGEYPGRTDATGNPPHRYSAGLKAPRGRSGSPGRLAGRIPSDEKHSPASEPGGITPASTHPHVNTVVSIISCKHAFHKEFTIPTGSRG